MEAIKYIFIGIIVIYILFFIIKLIIIASNNKELFDEWISNGGKINDIFRITDEEKKMLKYVNKMSIVCFVLSSILFVILLI
jgi:hypothetical protein